MDGVAASISLLALWLVVGVVFFFIRDRRRKEALRQKEIEELVAQWIARERKNGTPAEIILEQMPLKREEFRRTFE